MKRMKKIILFFSGFLALNAYSQVEIRLSGETQDISGTTITETITTEDVAVGSGMFWARAKFHVYNVSGADEQFRIKRLRVDAPAGWNDEVCWPPTCYSTSGNTYLTPSSISNPAPTIYDGGSTTDLNGGSIAEIKPQIYPGALGSSATYRYIVTDVAGTTHYDSITLVLNYVELASISATQKNMELTMAPNPATDLVTIQADGVTDGKIRIVDVLGNVVYTGEFNNVKKLNLSDYKNGVYFVTIHSASTKGLTKKLVIKH